MSETDITVLDDKQVAAFAEALDRLLHDSASKLVRDATPGPFLDWIARFGPARALGMLPPDSRGPAHAADAARLMRLFGHLIYGTLPLPQHQFQPKKLPLPGRNDPCLCGSLAKFKQCCEPMVPALPKLPPEMAMPHVLDAMGKAAWQTLPALKVPPRLIEAAASVFRDEHRAKDAVALLEPWAAAPGRYSAAWAGLLDLLGDLYADLGKPRKRKALAEAMIERGEPAVQSKGWQRLCLMRTDAGRHDDARQAFANAQRLTPDDPAITLLEISMLLGFGEGERASERALFQIRRLGRMNDGGRFNDLIEALRDLGARGQDYLEEVQLSHEPDLHRLDAWAAALPPPQLRLDLNQCRDDDFGELRPLPALAKLLRRWQQVFDVEAPALVALQGAQGDPWRGFDSWMALLEQEPHLGDSFEVLDGLLLALEKHPSGAAAAVMRRLVTRGLALWAALRERHPRARSEWAVWPNRPAMRILAQHIAGDHTPTAEHSFDALRYLVEVLNPNDNHGFRARLAPVLLRRGLFADALALAARYPDDMDEMALARVLALWHEGQRGAATALLAETLGANNKLAKVMRSRVPPKPRRAEFVTVGSLQEAQLAYAEQFDLWQAAELRELIAGVTRTLKA